MWKEKTKKGYKFTERYKDPLTGEYRRCSITLEKDTAQSRKVAQKALNERIERAMNKVQSEDITLHELILLYGEELKGTVKLNTYDRNIGACRTLEKILGGNIYVGKLTAGYVRKKLVGTGRENGTLNEWLTRYKSMIRWGYQNDYVKDISYLQKLKRFKDISHREKIQDKFLESWELKELINCMTVEKWKDLTEFLALSGLRFGEAAALTRSDVDLKKREIHVAKTYNQSHDIVTSTKTGTSTRDVYMQDQLYELCKKIMHENKVVKMDGIFFPGTSKEHIQFDSYSKYLRENSEKIIGRRITPHTLRHTHASLLMEQGIDIGSISRRLGHANSKITREIYLHVTRKLKEKEEEKIRCVKII